MASKNRIIFTSIFLLFLVLLPYARAWDDEDHEIFSLVDDLEASEGKDVNFYSWLGLEPTATEKDIHKAYRKLSLAVHPDKNPDDKSKERFARLGVIAAILRNPDMRERYNFFLKNGVPRWRGTGYYYERYRPGLGIVLIGLLSFVSFLHYIVMWVNYLQEKKRIRNYINDSRELAWGKKMKKQQTKKRVFINELAFVVEGDNVSLLTDEGEYVLDEKEIARPKITDVLIFVLPGWFYKNIKKQFSKKKSKTDDSIVNPGYPGYEKEGFSSDDEHDNIRKTRKRRGGNKRK